MFLRAPTEQIEVQRSNMQAESDPNVLYGGDLIEATEPIGDQYPSLGALILSDLKLGENKPSFVSEKKIGVK